MRSKYGRGVGSSEVTKEARKVFGIGEKIPKDLEMEGKLPNGATIRILKAGIQTCFRISIDAETWHHHNATTLLTPEMLIQMGEWAKTLVSKKE